MAAVSSMILVLAVTLSWGVEGARAQASSEVTHSTGVIGGTGTGAPDGEAAQPLPDIPALMHEVEEHEKAGEAVQKDYLYHAADTVEELDGNGRVKKTESR